MAPEIASEAFSKTLTPAITIAGFTKARTHPFKRNWVDPVNSLVFKFPPSFVQLPGIDVLRALRLQKFEELVQKSATRKASSNVVLT